MNDASKLRSGKGHRDENFPVASWLIRSAPSRADPGVLRFRAHGRRHRRSRDACRRPKSSRCSIDSKPGSLGKDDNDAVAVRLRAELAERNLSPQHAQDLLTAFTHGRHQAALSRLGRSDRLLHAIRRCRSAASSRRARREPRRWPANDALCAACRSSITCRIARRTTAISTASTFRWMRSPMRHDGRSARRAASSRRRCWLACTGLPAAPNVAVRKRRICRS